MPLRIEVGPKDLANQSFLYARRDTGAKASLKLDASSAESIKVICTEWTPHISCHTIV